MKQYYHAAIEHGGDHIAIALGNAERRLKKAPKDKAALAYKGSLLTMMSQSLPTRQASIYHENGVEMMRSVLETLDPSDFNDTEAYFICVTGLLDTDEPWAQVEDALPDLLSPPRFELLTDFEAVIALMLDADIADEAGDVDRSKTRIKEARARNLGLATQAQARRAARIEKNA